MDSADLNHCFGGSGALFVSVSEGGMFWSWPPWSLCDAGPTQAPLHQLHLVPLGTMLFPLISESHLLTSKEQEVVFPWRLSSHLPCSSGGSELAGMLLVHCKGMTSAPGEEGSTFHLPPDLFWECLEDQIVRCFLEASRSSSVHSRCPLLVISPLSHSLCLPVPCPRAVVECLPWT